MRSDNLYVIGAWSGCNVILLEGAQAGLAVEELQRCGQQPVQTTIPVDYGSCLGVQGIRAIDYNLKNFEGALVNVLSAPSMWATTSNAEEPLKESFGAIFTLFGEAARSGLWEKLMIEVFDGKFVRATDDDQVARFDQLEIALDSWADAGRGWILDGNIVPKRQADKKVVNKAEKFRVAFPKTFPDIRGKTTYPLKAISWNQMIVACEYKILMADQYGGDQRQLEFTRDENKKQREKILQKKGASTA
jgi:hypothetical protein